jgi:hypothetical protein
MVHSIQTSLCVRFSMRRIHYQTSILLRCHQMVRASTMMIQSCHRLSVRFHRTVYASTMKIRSYHRLYVRFHQMACASTMKSQSYHRLCDLLHLQRMIVPQRFQRSHGYRMRIRMSCYPCGGQRCCNCRLAGCSNPHDQLDYFCNTSSSYSNRNTDVHQY